MEAISISEAESAVMEVLWSRHPLAADDIVAVLRRERDWQDATIKTLIGRLLKKGAVSATQDGRRYLYSPTLEREAWLTQESSSMLERLFGGRVAPLVAHFSKQRKLSKRDIAELRRIIDEMES
ncbi:BlaI/MecI/CopY family transcriptional regulator [Pseudoduganella rivuli]|uniref:BlaI/MecI/CopY family transcriptional regulator n=1 Tax=Pseudoduganella rivuli TaxID=2666085 RepID=UPI0012B05473|nr:BlaI/MecI/CopY family transcriptional regulator [Pseudoduganella rivuli]